MTGPAAPTPIPRQAITGIVLAGGLGRRMSADGQGLDKGLQALGGRPMAAHVIERLAPQVATIVLNANRNLDQWRSFGLPVVADRIEGFAGPLAGLHAALAFVRTPWVVTAPCDSPLLPPDLVARLAAGVARSGAPVAVACTDGQPQPAFALVSCRLADDLAAFLAAGGCRIGAWHRRLSAVEVRFDDAHAFDNLNTLEDLRRIEAALDPAGSRGPGR